MTSPVDTNDEAFAVLGMYPFPALRGAWQRLYEAVALRAAQAGPAGMAVPATLRWDLDPHDTWLDPQLAIGMTCGWPLVTALRDRVRVVGTFTFRGEPSPQPHLYRSVIIAREPSESQSFAARPAAISSADSLSGNISLLEAFEVGSAWPGGVTLTGGHLASIEAVRNAAADVASIDALTWAFQQRDAPETLAGLTVIGNGPWVPGLPVILPGAADDATLAAWRAAFAAALDDSALVATSETLRIAGFVALDQADYDAALAGLLQRHPPC